MRLYPRQKTPPSVKDAKALVIAAKNQFQKFLRMSQMKKITIIAEIGINHNGKFNIAQDLIFEAAKCGVTGVKFQYRNLANAYTKNTNQIGDEILLKEITNNYLTPHEIILLTNYAHSLNIEAGISFFDVNDLNDFGDDIHHFDFFKVPSVELNSNELVCRLLGFLKPVYVSLGCHSEAEIDHAFASFASDNWVALHCVSNYPVSLQNAKLGYLNHMKNKWNRPYGYSSHDENWEVCLIAMSMGATVIERHITFDKRAEGLDHTTSSTPEEFARIVLFAESMHTVLSGSGPRLPNQGEKLNLQNLGRSFYAKKDIKPNEIVTLDKLSFRSPRVGFGRLEIQDYIGKSPIRKIQTGEVLSRSAFEASPVVTEEVIECARKNKISLPVRLHDFERFEKKFPIGAYEFHLSFGEVRAGLKPSLYGAGNIYSIHLPDYINSTQLMDPFSIDAIQAKESLEIIRRTADFAKELQDRTGRCVPVVGSFSVIHKNITEFYEQHSALFNIYKNEGVSILPQWLPPIAWYFGGSVKLDVMNQIQDVNLIKKYNLPICMDVCHLCMGDSLFNFGAHNVIDELKMNIQHLHIADADGIDGEGLHLGEGAPKNMIAIKSAMDIDCIKVIEVWQGHLDDGAGFAKALNAMLEIYDKK
jgi:N-acetylneuraminate synthase